MTFPLNRLSALLAKNKPTPGVVTGFSGGFVVVATSNGAAHARYSGRLAVGDRVVVSAGVAERSQPAREVYQV